MTFGYPGPPGEEGPTEIEPFPEWLNGLKDSLEAVHYGEGADPLSKLWQKWVARSWIGASFTPAQLREAFSLVKTVPWYPVGKQEADAYARASPPGTPNPLKQVVLAGDDAANLLRRAWAIQAKLDKTTSQVAAVKIEGALSAVGLVLAIAYHNTLNYIIPYAGKYVGVGDPATSLEGALPTETLPGG